MSIHLGGRVYPPKTMIILLGGEDGERCAPPLPGSDVRPLHPLGDQAYKYTCNTVVYR